MAKTPYVHPADSPSHGQSCPECGRQWVHEFGCAIIVEADVIAALLEIAPQYRITFPTADRARLIADAIIIQDGKGSCVIVNEGEENG